MVKFGHFDFFFIFFFQVLKVNLVSSEASNLSLKEQFLRIGRLNISNKTAMITPSPVLQSSIVPALPSSLNLNKKIRIQNYYRGLTPSLMDISSGAIQLSLYEYCKKLQSARKRSTDIDLSTVELMQAGCFSRFVACLARTKRTTFEPKMNISFF